MVVYLHSASYATKHGETDAYWLSDQANFSCKVAIEQAISTHSVSYTHLDVYKRQDRRNAYYTEFLPIDPDKADQDLRDVLAHGLMDEADKKQVSTLLQSGRSNSEIAYWLSRAYSGEIEDVYKRQEGNFPSSFFTPQPPLLWLRELWKTLRRYLSPGNRCV